MVERLTGIIARAAGNTVSPTVTALMQAAAITTGNIDLALWATPAGAIAGSLTEESVALLRSAWSDRSSRVQSLAENIAGIVGVPVEQVPRLASGDANVRRLLGVTVEAATEAESAWKLRVLATAFTQGAKDPAKVDPMVYVIEALKDVEAADARVLAAVSVNPHVRITELIEHDAGLAPALPLLLDRLIKMGLLAVGRNPNTYYLTAVGAYCAGWLDAHGWQEGAHGWQEGAQADASPPVGLRTFTAMASSGSSDE